MAARNVDLGVLVRAAIECAHDRPSRCTALSYMNGEVHSTGDKLTPRIPTI
ncbi:MAG: hypothetical protein NVS4B3_26000 [Gemmatimonadaceae bacterium]